MTTAFVTGITGQDGAYLARLLLEQGRRVVGGVRRTSTSNLWRLRELGLVNDVELVDFELLDSSNIRNVIRQLKPAEFYNLAAQSFVGTSFTQAEYTSKVDGFAVLHMLEALREYSPQTRFYQASTSELFGDVVETPQKATTPFHPRSPYGVAKQYAHWITKNYREAYGMHASCGILFNHESPLRGVEFVTRKITQSLAQIKLGQLEVLKLGNIDAKRDWGFAGDYVEAMFAMVQNDMPSDHVVATGVTTRVRDFVEMSAKCLDIEIEWSGQGSDEVGKNKKTEKTIIQIDKNFYRPAEVYLLIGDPSETKRDLGWQATMQVEELAKIMTFADLERAQQNAN